MTLRTRILFSFLGLSLIPFVLFGATAYMSARTNLAEVERLYLQEALIAVERALNNIEDSLAQTVRDYSNWDDMHRQVTVPEPDYKWLGTNLDVASPSSPIVTFGLSMVGLRNVQGKFVFEYGPVSGVLNHIGQPLEDRLKTGEQYTTLVYFESKAYIISASPVRTSDSSDPQGLLLMARTVGPDDMGRIKTLTGYDVAFYRGVVQITAPSARATPLLYDLEKSAEGERIYDQRDANVALAYGPLRNDQGNIILTLVVWSPRTAMIAAQNSITESMMIWVVVCAVVAVIGSILLSNSIARPILDIARQAHLIAGGDYSRRIPPAKVAKDELHTLAESFNVMAGNLVQTIRQLDAKVVEIDAKNVALAEALDRAEEATRAKSQFLANVSHELRTPLNAILGYSDLLLMKLAGPINEKQERAANSIKDNGRRLLGLITDLIDSARIEAGKLQLIIRPFSPHEMASRLCASLSILAEKKKLEFETQIDPNLPDPMLGDALRIEQIVSNLLSNAFKFTDKGKVQLIMAADLEKRVWTIAVRDTGIGIPASAMTLIFEVFRQVDDSPTRSYQGSGLGLSITRHLVMMMGGSIAVQSAEGAGSTFTITLPITTPAPENTEEIAHAGV